MIERQCAQRGFIGTVRRAAAARAVRAARAAEYEHNPSLALRILQTFSLFYSHDVILLLRIAKLALRCKRFDTAFVFLQRAVREGGPHHIRATRALGNAYIDAHQFTEGLYYLRHAVALDRHDWRSWLDLALALRGCSQVENARVCLQNAASCASTRSKSIVHFWLARLHEDTGDRKSAERLFLNACRDAGRKGVGTIYYNYVHGGYCVDSASHVIEHIHNILSDEALSDEARAHLFYALGHLYDKAGQYPEAFQWFQRANLIRWTEQGGFPVQQYLQDIDRSKRVFTDQLLDELAGDPREGAFLIAIVGMPRSGTTLLEQILSSHKDVYGAGERPDLYAVSAALRPAFRSRRGVRRLRAEKVQQHATYVAARLRSLSDSSKCIVTKRPQDVFELGTLRILLPGARIIHIQRSAADTCLSCYMQNFREVPFSTDLEVVAEVYRGYLTLVDHWRYVIPPGTLHEVRYEELVLNPGPTIAGILEFCGLGPDERCESFYRQHRVIDTPSHWEVRQPLYSSSIGRAANYAECIGSRFDRLPSGPELVSSNVRVDRVCATAGKSTNCGEARAYTR